MDKAKEAVSKFTSKHGHQTEVSESYNPAVRNEEIKPLRHEETTQAIDREVHQHHHHTTVQPLHDRQVLPERHSHQIKPVEERSFNHENQSETRERLQADAAKFQHTRKEHPTQLTEGQAPTVQGEHVHHHVHERVQPVIHKETIVPEKVHTTVPIHEIHHADTQFHGTSVLPTKSLSEFSSGGGSLDHAGTTSHGTYEGRPREYNKDMMHELTDADKYPHKKGVDGPDSHHTGGVTVGSNEPFRDDGHQVRREHGGPLSAGHEGSGLTTGGTESQAYGTGQGNNTTTSRGGLSGNNTTTSGGGLSGNNTTTSGGGLSGKDTGLLGKDSSIQQKKPSLIDKLNPKIDSNGDGKAGFLK